MEADEGGHTSFPRTGGRRGVSYVYADTERRGERFAGVRPLRPFSITEDGVRHRLDPKRDRLSPDHRWVRQRPELWEVVDKPVPGQDPAVGRERAARTRERLIQLLDSAEASLTAGRTRTSEPDHRDERGGGLRLPRSRHRALRLPT
jgi:hypothetical protein